MVVEVRIKKLTGDLVKVEMGDTTLSVTAKLPTGVARNNQRACPRSRRV